MKPLSNRFLTTSCLTAAMLLAVPAFANPADGVVASGAANISASGNTLHVVQSTHKAVIDWGSFNISAGETTAFHQPSSSAITLNRVHSASASVIDGNLTANGNIFIVNQNGVLFGAGSRVDVNGLVVSTADISNHNFNAGNFRFDQPGNPTATIENRGQITAAEAGLVGMVAPNVLNSGTINARLGRVHLASGDTATVDLYGDGLMEVAVSDAVASQLVRNTGTIAAEGGTIALTAAAGGNLVNSLIEVRGELRAPSVGVRNGKIIIAAAKAKQSGVSTVVVEDALLDVSGNHAGETGGRVTITGDRVAVMGNTMIDANGAEGGGIVHIGGEYLGGGNTPTALITLVQDGVTVNASALVHGHGGEVIMYADERTEFGGSIEANGAGDEGNGGFVETSGRNVLLAFGRVRTIAGRNGKAGTWLLDPADITITASTTSNAGGSPNWTASGTTAQVSAATIKASLDGGTNVTVTTSNDGHAGNGDITVSSAISTTGSGSLTLSAYRSIAVNASIALNAGTLTLQSNNTGAADGSTGTGAVRVSAAISTTSGNIKIGGGSGVISAGSGYAVGDGTYVEGVRITSNVTSTSGGSIVINGRGYATGSSNYGVSVTSGAIVSTVSSGAITIYGLGGGTTGNNYGISVNGSTIRNTSSGAVQLTGVGGASSVGGSTNDFGVWVGNTGFIQAANNDITITGTGGGSAGTSSNFGIATSSSGATIETTGSGNITINGIGGAGTSNTGFLANYSATSNTLRTTGSGNITINADTINIAAGATVNSIGTLTLRPYTTSTTMGIGPSSGSALNVSNTYLGTMTAASYVFGSTTTGNLTIDTTTDFGTKNVSFISGGNISLANNLTKATGAGTATYLLQANGNITNVTGKGISASTGAINLTLNSDYDQSTSAGGYITLSGGTFNTNGGSLTIGGGATPASGNAYSATAGQHGVSLSSSNVVTTSGGAISIRGEASATSADMGVSLLGSISSGAGAISLYGRSTSNNSSARAVLMNGAATISSTSGNITLTAVNASGNSGAYGFLLYNAGTTGGTISSTSGNITIDTSRGSNETSFGLVTSNTTNAAISSTNGNVTILADTRYTSSSGTQYSAANGTLTYATKTGVTMGVGPSSGSTSNLTTAELGQMTAANYIFGSTTTGNLTINTTKDFGASNVSFLSSGNITLAGTLTKGTGAGTATYLLQANGNISNSGSAGVIANTGAVNLTLTSDNDVSGAGSITLTSAPLTVNGGTITLNSNGQSVTQSGSIGGDETINSSNGAVSIGALEADTASTRSLTANAGTATFTTTAAIGATNKLNNLTVVSNDVALGANIGGTGTLTLQPNASNSEVRLNDATAGGTYTLSSTELGYFVNGWSGITIGKSTNSGSMYMGTTSWSDPVTFLNNFRTSMTNSLTASGNASVTFNVGGSGWINQASIVTAGQNVSFSGAGAITGASNITTSGGSISAVTVQVNGSAASPTWSTSGGNINITGTLMRNSSAGSTAAKTFTMNAGSGTIGVAGTVNGDYSLSATGSTITLSGAVGGTEALSALSLTSTNSLTLPSITATSITAQTTGASSDITIASGKTLTASGSGSAITLAAARNFINSSGSATPLVAASGRWLVYSTNPSADTRGGMTSGFVRYGCTYGGSCPTGTSIAGSGNGFVFTYQPTLTITPSALAAITYGAAAPSLVGYSYSSSGYVAAGSSVTGAAESTADTLGGTLTGTTTYTAGSNVGSYNVNYSSGTLTSALGYAFTYANNASAITVGQRTLTAGLTGAVSKTYDATTAATLASSNYSLSNVYSTDDVSISTTSGTYADANVGTGKTISVSGLTLGGTKAANYTLASGSTSGAIGAITKAALTATADTKTISAGTTVPAGSATYSGFVGGETSAVIDTLATIASAQSGTPAAGTYTGNYTASSAVDNNYSFSYVAGDLLVTAGSGGGSGGSGTTTTTLPPTVELAFNHALVSITPPSAMLDLRPLLSVTSRGDSSQTASANEARTQHRIHTRNEVAAGRLLEDALIYVTPSLARELELDQSQI